MKRATLAILSVLTFVMFGIGAWSFYFPVRFGLPGFDGARVRFHVAQGKLLAFQIEPQAIPDNQGNGAFLSTTPAVLLAAERLMNANDRWWDLQVYSRRNWVVYLHCVIPCVILGAYPFFAVLREVRRRRMKRIGKCARCGYDLTGNISGRCSECGAPRQTASTCG